MSPATTRRSTIRSSTRILVNRMPRLMKPNRGYEVVAGWEFADDAAGNPLTPGLPPSLRRGLKRCRRYRAWTVVVDRPRFALASRAVQPLALSTQHSALSTPGTIADGMIPYTWDLSVVTGCSLLMTAP